MRSRLRPAAAGDRPPRGERPSRPVLFTDFTGEHHRLLGGRLHARAAAHGDTADGSDPGPRRRVAQRLLRQRRLAGVAQPDVEPRPALRGEHARPDLRRSGVDARRGLRDDHPERVPVARASSSTSRTTRTSRPRLGATYRLGEKTVVRAGFGIYYNPNQMNSFTFLTNNPPLAPVTTYTSDPANPDAVVREPERPGGAGGPARHDLADARLAQCAQGSVELRRAARARAGHGARLSVPRLEHQPPGSQLLQQHADARRRNVDPRRPSQNYRSRRIIQNDLIADYDARQHHPAQAHEPGPAGRRALHLVAHARHGDALERRRRDDGQLRHLARLRSGELGHPAPVRRELHLRRAVPQGLVAADSEVRGRGLAGLGHDDDPERLAGQHHVRRAIARTSASAALQRPEPRRRDARARIASRTQPAPPTWRGVS